MTPNQFVSDALRTESHVNVIKANNFIINDTLDAIIALSEILDQIKKNTFYGKAFNHTKLTDAIHMANMCINRIYNLHQSNNNSLPLEQQSDLKVNPRLFHSIIGVATESAELLAAMNVDSPNFDKVNILEEFGDLNWYEAIAVDELSANFEEDVLNRVITKLRTRYPEKFINEAAINRDLAKERTVLEGGISRNICDNTHKTSECQSR